MKHYSRIVASNAHPIIVRLTETRLAWGLTVKDLASRIGCSDYTLMHMESGQELPSGKLLIRWADVLGFSLSIWPKERK